MLDTDTQFYLQLVEQCKTNLIALFPDDLIKEDKPKPSGFVGKYIESQHIISRLNASCMGWSFMVVKEERVEDQYIVHGKLEIMVAPGISLGSRYQVGSVDIKTREGQGGGSVPVDLGSDKKAAHTDCLKKCATLFGVAQQLYYDKDDANKEGVQQDKRDMQNAVDSVQFRGGPQPFQIEMVKKLFSNLNVDSEYWLKQLKLENAESMDMSTVNQILDGSHPFLKYLAQEGYNIEEALGGGLDSSNA